MSYFSGEIRSVEFRHGRRSRAVIVSGMLAPLAVLVACGGKSPAQPPESPNHSTSVSDSPARDVRVRCIGTSDVEISKHGPSAPDSDNYDYVYTAKKPTDGSRVVVVQDIFNPNTGVDDFNIQPAPATYKNLGLKPPLVLTAAFVDFGVPAAPEDTILAAVNELAQEGDFTSVVQNCPPLLQSLSN